MSAHTGTPGPQHPQGVTSTPGNRMPLTAIKSAVRPGSIYDVTNHYIRRPEHPSYATTRRRVTRVTGSSVYMVPEPPPADIAAPKWPTFTWPRASQAEMDSDGTIRLYGGGAGQRPDELFLMLIPVKDGSQ